MAFEGAMLIGLVKLRALVRATLKKLDVEFLNCQNVPPDVVAVVAGVTMLEKPELVI